MKLVWIRRAINYFKGCYLGQEVISRIKSVGHVNRHLCGLLPAQRLPGNRGQTGANPWSQRKRSDLSPASGEAGYWIAPSLWAM